MTTPDEQAPAIHTWISRTWNGVRVDIDEDRSIARIDIGTLPSYELVGTIERRIAPAITGCATIEILGENITSVAYLAEQLPKILPTTESWLHQSEDTRRGVA